MKNENSHELPGQTDKHMIGASLDYVQGSSCLLEKLVSG